jgi:PAS domain S-box-containing protein
VKDCEGNYIMVNKRYQQIFGFREELMQGRTDFDFFPPEIAKQFRENDLQVVRTGEPLETEEVAPHSDGLHTYITVKFPIRKLDGSIQAIASIATDITPRKRVESELHEAKERLARANEDLEIRVQERTASLQEAIAQMEEFSYSVSHDLRAPVRAMKGYAQAALEDYGERLDDRGRDYLERVVRGSSRMERLIHDVLTYSRLARSEMRLQLVSLQGLLPEIIQQYPAMQPPNAIIIIRAPLHPMLAHEPSLTQAISNLLSNGIKFVAPGTLPQLQVWTEEAGPGKIRLWIEDNGIGIKPEYQHRLFGMFERVHQNNNYDGTGIGLAIVRKAVEKMGGNVGVDSDGLTGSSFWIELPAADSQ